MHDGTFDLSTLGGLEIGRLDGLSEAGLPRVARADGTTEEARSLVPLAPTDLGRELAAARAAGGMLLILGLLQPPARRVVADGEVTVIEAARRLELRCGPASIALFADGRVEVRGTHLLSRADGANRVQGGSVLLN